MYKWFVRALILAFAGLAIAWQLTKPTYLEEATLVGIEGNAERGQDVFWAGGCASCHSAEKATGDDRLVLEGGRKFPSDFGTFIAPNISPDLNNGIGGWTFIQFANAVQKGVSPEGQHYFPAFPYNSYSNATVQDIADLKAFMDELPKSQKPNEPHDVGFPFNIRRSLGGWKFLFAKRGWSLDGDLTPEEERGRYLAEALGHCAECHTPRNPLGGLKRKQWMSGAMDPTGKFEIPNITSAELTWSKDEIVEYFTSGFTPDFDTVGGHMTEVVDNFGLLPASDRSAIAAYLKKIPAIE